MIRSSFIHRTPGRRLAKPLLLALALLLLSSGPTLAKTSAQSYQESYVLEAKGKYKEALKVIQRLPAVQQRAYIYKLRMAWLRYLMGQYKAAVTHYKQAAAIKPRAIEPLLGMMLPQMAARTWKDASSTARRVLRMAPNNYLAQSRLAWILFNLGRNAEAARVYRKVLELFPADLEMQAGLGWTLLKLGKKTEARSKFNAILEISPRNRSALSGLKALKSP